MLYSIEILFKRMIDTLQDLIVPALPSPYLKGQALSIVGILNNLVGRIEENHKFYLKRNADICQSLKDVVDCFRAEGKDTVPKPIEYLCDNILEQLHQLDGDQEMSYQTKNRELNRLIEEILIALEEHKDCLSLHTREDIRKRIHQQLRQQLDEELNQLKLAEMGELFKRG